MTPTTPTPNPFPNAEPLASPFWPAWDEWANSIQTTCVVCSPYMTQGPVKRLTEILTQRGLAQTVAVHLITNLAPENFADGSSDLEALIWATSQLSHVSVTYLPSVHAKVMIADDHTALVGSANFTAGGSHLNREYGVRLREPAAVRRVAEDINGYAALGTLLLPHQLNGLREPVTALRESFQAAKKVRREAVRTAPRAESHAPAVPRLPRPSPLTEETDIHAQYAVQEQKIADNLLYLRARSQSTNALFGETILYLLARAPDFAMTTKDLNAQIQAIHPDLCDDTIDRVIDGTHFGKRWKHQVRGAQVTLQKRGWIVRETTGLWRLISPAVQ